MSKKLWLKWLLLLAVVSLLSFLTWYFLYLPEGSFLRLFFNKDAIVDFVESHGENASIVFIFLQAIQVVLAPIPGEFTGSIAGFLFGGFKGALYASIGLAIGSAIAFLLGKIFGRRIVGLMVSDKQIEKLSFNSQKKRNVVVLVVFLIPGFPKDSLTYLFSLSNIGFWNFFFLSQLGRLPGTLLLTFGSSALLEQNWWVLAVVAVLSAVLIIGGFMKRDALIAWLKE